MTQIPLLILVTYLATLITASAPTFCKCTCFTNSTIIRLGPQHDNDNPSSDIDGPRSPPLPLVLLEPRAASADCNQCNRKFCLDYNLPICKDAEEKDVVTKCFQRDSRKDQFIVWGFVLGTAGLLGWASIRRVLEMREVRKASGGFFGLLGVSRGAGAGGTASRGNGLFGRTTSAGAYSPLEGQRSGGGRGGG